MIDPFVLKLLLSFFVGSIWIVFLSIFSERFGSKIGGAIAGIPATMVVSLFFIGWTESIQMVVNSISIIPLIVGINVLFTVLFIKMSNNFYKAIISALFFWFILSIFFVSIGFNNFYSSLFIFFIIIISSYYILEKRFTISSIKKKKVNYTKKELFVRAVLSGILILISVLLTRIGGPLLGGAFASFPVLTVALILILYRKHQMDFTNGLLKNFILSGSINVVIFITIVRFTLPTLGLFFGIIISFFASLISAYLTYNYINKKLL